MRRLWRLRHSPVFWGIAYLALIPAFATAYSVLPAGSFYDSNVKREEAIPADAEKLNASLRKVFEGRSHPVVWSVQGHKVKARSFWTAVTETPNEEHFLLAVGGDFRNLGKRFEVAGSFVVWVEVLEGALFTIRPNGMPKVVLAVALTRPGHGSEEAPEPRRSSPSVSRLFPSPSGALGQAPRRGTLTIPEGTYQQMRRFQLALAGDPSVASGRWIRMAYLSAVTVTTLGFGDITPTSGAARLCVALEAVLGVVFIGVFLGTLARDRWRRPQAPG